MELKEFVSQTLVQIVQGVTEAQRVLNEGQSDNLMHAVVSPEVQANQDRASEQGYLNVGNNRQAQIVKFDVALGASNEVEGKAKMGIGVAYVTFGASGTKSEGDTSLSRVQFSVPLILPTHKE